MLVGKATSATVTPALLNLKGIRLKSAGGTHRSEEEEWLENGLSAGSV